MIETKIYKGYKLTIPAELRKQLNINEGDTVKWNINEKGKLELDIETTKNLMDFPGMISDDTLDSVEAKKKTSREESLK